MDEQLERRRRVLGCLGAATAVVATALGLLAGGVWLVARDLDLDFDALDVPDVDDEPIPASTIRALDSATGAERWRQHFGSDATYVGLAGDLAVVRDDEGTLLGIEATSGRERWRRPGAAAGEIVVGDQMAFATTGRGSLVATDLATGEVRWKVRGAAAPGTDPLAAAGVVAVIEPGLRVLRAFDSQTGAVRWVTDDLPALDVASSGGAGDLVLLRSGGDVVALDAATGAARWTRPQPAVSARERAYFTFLDPPVGAGESIGVGIVDETSGGEPPTTSTVFLDATTGAERWRTSSGSLSSFAYDPGALTLYEYGQSLRLVARDPLTGAIRWEADSRFGRLLAAGGSVFLADDIVRAFDASTGARRWTTNLSEDADATPVGVSNGVVLVATAED